MTMARRGLQKSDWGVLGEKIHWPAGFFPERRLPGTGVHGETWVIKNNVMQVSKELTDLRDKLVAGIQKLDQGIEEAAAAMNEPLDGEGDDDIGYDDEFDFADRFDPHDRTDPEVLLEERQGLQTELQDRLDEVNGKLAEMQQNELNFTWKRREIPHQLHCLTRPWEDFNKAEMLAAKQAADEAAAAEREALERRSRRKGNVAPEPSKEDEPDMPDTFVAKLVEPAPVYTADGRRMGFSDGGSDNADTLLAEGEAQMKVIWRFIVERGNFDFEDVGLVPIVYVGTIKRQHKDFKPVENAIFIRPYFKHGTVGDVIKNLAGKKKSLYYKDDLLVTNAHKFISCMAYMENCRLYHGSIHPNNIFVSDDGFRLLVGDFLPPSEFKRWMVSVAKRLSSVPTFLSPEYREALVTARIQKPQYYTETLSPYKNDVYAFGLVLLYLATMEEPTGVNQSAKKAARAVERLRHKGRHEDLLSLVSAMLTFNPQERPSWKELLMTGERLQLQAADVLRGLGNLFGVTLTNPEDQYMDKDLRDPRRAHAAATKHMKRQEGGQTACTIM
ncbi:protein kinase (incomplete catalytic triad) [Toxoplasma gondii RUB]|uniref:Protein kinase (Incomplete catalytic triad) n=9 Tax=Toxoplasma gondii TaxID=5811 RepID=V4YRW0_TOXGV|nr:protein kinase (incomplete catalytic triad) [Toxoplasma gondii VEG]KFG36792.1 protein kinase (incomplete catalytic triad) [Toxoplasma gondii p89]KFG44039.1 protein kinase (incomplete catalytic triad) [Toxoplasma gondii FOU]KFG62412.1 protein kinase (incomplete catalytic triad) [Toxoplasma gondii RUB]KFH07500.1 protein kinase (incomplete catalytic triad) [Toxoplasma gondii VAND]KFH16255.1 protein kinase (incomplete catalytic triad) [Toxoplasma gondii MAS]PIL99407.1 protein kinase (incomplet